MMGRGLTEKENVVLIGMPTAGKTTVGRLIARRLDRPFYDTDELFFEKTGVSTAEYIVTNGEAAFRAVESQIVAQVSRNTGCVIAVGGGAVLLDDNVRALKRGGLLVFLDRPLEHLTAAGDRPLSSDRKRLDEMFVRRRPVYQVAADCTVSVSGTAEETADAVLKELER